MIFLIIVFFISLILNFVLGYYLIKFARIIFSIEELLSNALEVLEATKNGMQGLIQLNFLIDVEEIKIPLTKAIENIKMSELALGKLIQNFTNLSKNKYVFTRIEIDNEEEE